MNFKPKGGEMVDILTIAVLMTILNYGKKEKRL